MGDEGVDPDKRDEGETGEGSGNGKGKAKGKKTKLELVQEYVARVLEPKVSSLYCGHL